MLVLSVVFISGCATWAAWQEKTVRWYYPHATGEGLGLSPDDHARMASSISAHDARALVDDLDVFFMTDRPTRLTRWHDR